MKLVAYISGFFLLFSTFSSLATFAQQKTIDQKVDSVLSLMTLDEKMGQLNQYSSDFASTGPITKEGDKQNQIRAGKIGSFLNVIGAARNRSLQEIAMQSRLRIPLLMGQDVIHGIRTIFPIPLAEAASWDLTLLEQSARIAATEAAAAGIHWTFAPMVDIARDPRWGRVMEGAGEDPFLGSMIARARVKGFQGKGLGKVDAIMACAKHFAAYGAAVGGRDYNSVDMSLRQLYEVYLPPFKAAAEAGVATFMNAFNDLNGVPATGNHYLQRKVLKQDWKFKGFVVSDWGSIGEMINHGFAIDNKDAAHKAIIAGSDMDMESRRHISHLGNLVREGKVPVATIDDAVRRVLRKKFEMGLFEDPFRFCDTAREQRVWSNPTHRVVAREIARKSIVLLKNESPKGSSTPLLPLQKTSNKKIALIGPFIKAVGEHNGFWSYSWPDDSLRMVTIWQGLQSKLGKVNQLLYAQGCSVQQMDTTGFAEARKVALQSDVIVLSVGEAHDMSGEAKSKSSIRLPGVQELLVKEMVATGKPVVVLISAGRPLVFNWISENVPAILYTWWLGTEAGNAIADVLVGDYNPAGKLPMTFPRNEGQIPIYYNYYSTGRPFKSENDFTYVTAYIDLPNTPQYPFGYGLSYTQFSYDSIRLSSKELKIGQQLEAKIRVTNTGSLAGEEVVQLYVQDETSSLVRPVRELKGFQKISLQPGESKELVFRVGDAELAFYNEQLEYKSEPGVFHIYLGGDSRADRKASFTLL
ncbi:MAG: glycoside hydrolase family 3 N-terminal domain-containing protein [Chitinophagaceae bacterium]